MMIEILKKIVSIFTLIAIFAIAVGFSDGMIAQAKTFSMDEMYMSNEMMHIVSNENILHQEMPSDNSLKPCCENRQGGASAIQASAFNQDLRIFSIDATENSLDNNFVFEYKISQLSSSSPPKSDILFSVLKKE